VRLQPLGHPSIIAGDGCRDAERRRLRTLPQDPYIWEISIGS